MSTTTWLIVILVKGTLLLLGAIAVAAGLRRASAALRHIVWGLGIVAVLILPLVSVALPWRLAVVPMQPQVVSTDQGSPGITRNTTAPPTPSATTPETATLAHDSAPTAGSPTISSAMLLRLVLIVWGIGALYFIARLVFGAFTLRRVVRRGVSLETHDWRSPLLEGADRLGLAVPPRLLMSDRFPMPFACGVLHPVIVLPEGAADWDDRRRRTVLVHELAHLARRDLLVNALGQVACALYWFHPLVWMAARKLRSESERACDDLVLGVGTRPSEYADHLLQIVCRATRSRTPAVALPMAQRHEFEGRMLAILERVARRDPASGRLALVLGALALSLVIPLAALAPVRARGAVHLPAIEASSPPAPTHVATPTLEPTSRPSGRSTASAPAARSPVTSSTAVAVAPVTQADTTAVVSALVRALADSVASVREDAAYALGQLQASSAVEPLVNRLGREPSAKVREMIGWALGQIESRSATPALAAAAQRDTSDDVRAMAVWALAQIQDPAAVPALTALLADRSTEVRGRAAWAIGTIEPSTAPVGLINALGDPSADVRLRAAWALGQIADGHAVARLSATLSDSASEVRRAAMWALGKIGGDAAQGALLKALEDPDPEVRARAARALGGSSGDPWPWPWPMPIIR